jgi:hypothetical protein
MVIQTSTTNGCNYGPAQTVSVGASPFTFINPENVPILVTVSGGTVTGISMSSTLLGTVSLGLLGWSWYMNPGHSLVVTYTIAPTMVYWPI